MFRATRACRSHCGGRLSRTPVRTPRSPINNVPKRSYALTATRQPLSNLGSFLQDKFREYETGNLSMREMLATLPPCNPTEVFANATTELAGVKAVGVDYDFTLASYTDELQPLIYDFAVDNLVKSGGYPIELKKLSYDPSFAVRGLYFDKRHGFLLKLNYLNNIQRDSVYYGRRNLSEKEVLSVYGIWKIPELHLLEKFRLISDIFSLPEACLLADVIQFMVDSKYQFHPAMVCDDVRKTIDQVHMMGQFQGMIKKNPEKYLEKSPRLVEFITRLREANKSVFMLTNNVFQYIDDGMNFLVANQLPSGMKHWTELFDVVMTKCRKPHFFTSKNQEQFRAVPMFNHSSLSPWKPVTEFQPGLVTTEGSLTELHKITGWKGNRVLYFGDHLDNDVVEPSRIQGWRTGVILKELERDIAIQNQHDYRLNLSSLILMEELLRRAQLLPPDDPARSVLLEKVQTERINLRKLLKQPFNQHFGSVFRTHVNPTLFSYYLQRYSDIYTSSLSNLADYPMDYCFYPSRSYLPHEFTLGRAFLDYQPEP